MDYCFLTDELEFVDEEGDTKHAETVLILHDDSLDCVSALLVESKGVNELALKLILHRLEAVSYTHLTLPTILLV